MSERRSDERILSPDEYERVVEALGDFDDGRARERRLLREHDTALRAEVERLTTLHTDMWREGGIVQRCKTAEADLASMREENERLTAKLVEMEAWGTDQLAYAKSMRELAEMGVCPKCHYADHRVCLNRYEEGHKVTVTELGDTKTFTDGRVFEPCDHPYHTKRKEAGL